MKVLQINANLDFGSTGVIMQDIGACAEADGIGMYYAYQNARSPKQNAIKVGNNISWLIHAFMCRLFGMQAFFSVFSTLALLRKISVIHPDIVHLHNLHNNYINIPILLKYLAKNDIRTIITMHDCWWFTGKCTHYVDIGCNRFQEGCHDCPKRMKDIPAILYDSSNYIWRKKKELLERIPRLTLVGCSEWICNEARKSFLKNRDIRQIYNGVDTTIFNAKERKKHSSFVIMGMANKWLRDSEKDLIDAIIDKTNACITIVGCSVAQQKWLKQYGDRVNAIGYIKEQSKLADIYRSADVFVNLTHADTLPTVNMEAICCGTPVITYDTSGSPELVDESTGIVVKESDYEGIVAAIKKIQTVKFVFPTSEAFSKFDKNKCFRQYIKLYNE